MREYPSFREEKKLWKKGYENVVGVDEAGQGCLAGPVVAAAVSIKISNFQFPISKQFPNFQFSKFRDSKKLTPKQREKFYKLITKSPTIEWAIGRVSEKIIDKINILEATKLAMKKALKKIFNFQLLSPRKGRGGRRERSSLRPSIFNDDIFLIVDGNFKLDLPIPQKSIVKADEKVFSCAVASIIAKIKRDEMMKKFHQKYPQYGFDKHKGYPTKFHRKMLKKHGPCKIHRKSFRPIKKEKIGVNSMRISNS